MDPVFGQGLNFHNARTGAWLGSAAAGHNIMNLLATADGDRAYIVALNHQTNRTSVFAVDLRPRILAVDSASHSLSTAAIIVDGIALGPNLVVRVNGEERPHQIVRTGDSDTDLAIEIRLDQNDAANSTIVEVSTDLGTTDFALPPPHTGQRQAG